MNYIEWLRNQVSRLEGEIRANPVFENCSNATRSELSELRQTIVLHTYMRQQLLRRDGAPNEHDWADVQQELVLASALVMN